MIFSNGIVEEGLWRWVEYPWQRQRTNSVKSADAIVVLSGGRHLAPGKAKVIEWNDPDRFLAGIKLFKEGKASRLLFTGGSNLYQPGLPLEGEIYLDEAIAFGVPKKNIFTTPIVKNTAEEAYEIKKVLGKTSKSNSPKIILVTSAFHMQRAKHLFERQGITVHPFPVDFKSKSGLLNNILRNPYNWFPNSRSLASSSKALREIIGRVIYNFF